MADEADGAVPATLCRRSGKHSTPAFRLVFKPGQLVRGYAAAQTCSNMRGTCQAVAVVDVHVPANLVLTTVYVAPQTALQVLQSAATYRRPRFAALPG
jgi:hypothetical protein